MFKKYQLVNLGVSVGARRPAAPPSAVVAVAIDEKNGNIACASSVALSLYSLNGEVLASLSLLALSPVLSLCFVEAQFTVLGAVALVTGHQDGTIRLFRLDSTAGRHTIKSGANLEVQEVAAAQASSHSMMLTDAYSYTAHSAGVTALLMVPDGLISADASGKIVRAFAKDAAFPDVDFVLKPTE